MAAAAGTLPGGQTVTPRAITLTASSNTKTYDSTIVATATPTQTGTLVTGDTITNLSEAYTTATAGTSKTETIASYTVNDGNGGANYAVTTISDTTGVINKAAPTITARTNTKTYDSTATAAATPTVSGLIGNDTVTNLVEAYTSASAGSSKTLSVSGYTVNDGTNGGNYAITTVANTTGLINKAALTITATTNTKTYDSTVTAAATPTVAGLIGGDTVQGMTEVYASAQAGDAKTLAVNNYTISDGNNGGNYAVTTVTSTTGVINKAGLTITAVSNTKTYDSTTTASAAPTVSGLQGGDTVTGLAELYADRNAGSGKTLSVSAYLVNDGNTGGNYSITTVTSTTGVINKAALTVSAVTNTKSFDGSTTAAAIPTVTGLQGGDTVTGLSETYDNSNPGSGKTLSVASGFNVNDGNSGNNYTVTTATNATGVISGAIGTTTAVTTSQASVTYGTAVTFTITVTASGGTGSPTGSVEVFDNGSHDLGAATFLSSAGLVTTWTLSTQPKSLNVTNPLAHVVTASFTASGSFGNSAGTLAGGQTVTPRAITLTASSNTKTYDSTIVATATPTQTGSLVTGDTITNLTEAYTSATAGTGKTETIASYTVNDGNGGKNYAVTTVSDTTGVINKAALTVSAVTNTKTFDGTATAAATPTVAGLQGGDTITGLSETYDNSNPGTGKTLSVSSGFVVNDGNGGNNYTVATATNTTGVIGGVIGTTTTVSSSQASAVYGTAVTFTITVTAAGGTGGPTGSVEVFDNGSHDLGAATFAASSGLVSTWTLSTLPKTLNVTNPLVHTITASFTASASFGNSAGTLAGGQTVTPRAITLTASSNTKTYDSTTSATATPAQTGTLVSGDTITNLTEAYTARPPARARQRPSPAIL